MTQEEIMKLLNWLLQMNIITSHEYNQLLTKSLPFLE